MNPDIQENEDFKSQFRAYEEQQQKLLQRLMERKKEKQNNQKADNSDAEEDTCRISTDLNLLAVEQPVNEEDSKRLLEIENEQLRNQLREVTDENCRLYRLTDEKDLEIKQLHKKIQEDRLALSGVSGLAGDVAATKIVELTKKNREITAETQSEKAKVKQLNYKVKELEKELQTAIEKIHSLSGGDAGIKESILKMTERQLAENPEVKALQEKLNTANFKVMAFRNQLQSVKQELKMTQKLLANEVGEDVNIQSLLANSGSWRGRAQQILVLQSKVRDLENQLSQTKSRTSLSEIDEELLELTDARKLSAQKKNLLKIRRLEKEKKQTLEKLAGEKDALQKSHEEVQKYLDASKARNKVLGSEVKSLKGQILTLMEERKQNKELIIALLSYQKQMQNFLKHLSQQHEKSKESQQVLEQHLNNEVQKHNSLIKQLRQVLAEQEARIKELEEEIVQLTFQQESAHGGASSGAAHTPPSKHSEDPGFTLASGSNQLSGTGSARTVSKMGHVLVESAATKPAGLTNNIPPGRLTGTDSPDLQVLKTQLTEQRALCQAAELERNKLLELVTVLQKRVEECSDKILEAEKRFQGERRQRLLLEQQLQKLQVDPGRNTSAHKPALRSKTGEMEQLTPTSTSGVDSRNDLDPYLSKLHLTRGALDQGQSGSHSRLTLKVSDRKELSKSQLSKLPLESQMEELNTRLEICVDENEALKANLEATVRSKMEDLKLYQDTMDQIKGIFIQAIELQKEVKR